MMHINGELQSYSRIGYSERTKETNAGKVLNDSGGYSNEVAFYPVENDTSLKAFISMKRCNLTFVLERPLSCHWGR